MTDLAQRQADLVAALVAGGDPPPGFDPALLRATQVTLRRKRAGETARAWPLLAASLASRWPAAFLAWADRRPPAGAVRDGWDFARALADAGELPGPAVVELAGREARLVYDGAAPPRRRRAPAMRRIPGGVLLQVAGRVFHLAARGWAWS